MGRESSSAVSQEGLLCRLKSRETDRRSGRDAHNKRRREEGVYNERRVVARPREESDRAR